MGTTHHKAAPYVFLASNDKHVSRNGCRADITPTILARLGVDPAKLTPALDGEPLTRPATKPIGQPVLDPKAKDKAKGKKNGGNRKTKAAAV